MQVREKRLNRTLNQQKRSLAPCCMKTGGHYWDRKNRYGAQAERNGMYLWSHWPWCGTFFYENIEYYKSVVLKTAPELNSFAKLQRRSINYNVTKQKCAHALYINDYTRSFNEKVKFPLSRSALSHAFPLALQTLVWKMLWIGRRSEKLETERSKNVYFVTDISRGVAVLVV